jgi:hypothetical protein
VLERKKKKSARIDLFCIQIIKNEERMTLPTTTDIQKSSGDFLSTEPIKEKDDKEMKIKKGSLTLPIKKKKSKESKLSSKKKSNLFSKFFRHSERNSKVPALNLPSIERDLSPNNPLRPPHRHDSDPLRVPSIDLPKLDLPLPVYDRPEVNMTTGYSKQSSEFAIPVIDFPPIKDLKLPEGTNQSIQLNVDQMKAPHVQLPDLKLTLTKQENVKLPEKQIKQEAIPTIQSGLTLSSPIDDMLSIQTDHKSFPIETDYAIKSETIVSTQITTSLSDQQITIIDTHLIQSSEVSVCCVNEKCFYRISFESFFCLETKFRISITIS